MKNPLLTEINERLVVAKIVHDLAMSLPDGGPAPSVVIFYGGGSIWYSNKLESRAWIGQAFGSDGWKSETKYGSTDYVKQLPNGVEIRIEHAGDVSPKLIHPSKFTACDPE